MNWKELLKPTWWKILVFVLPSIIIFGMLFVLMHDMNSVINFVCNTPIGQQGNFSAIEPLGKRAMTEYTIIKAFVSSLPVPCEFSDTNGCFYFTTKTTYDCMKDYVLRIRSQPPQNLIQSLIQPVIPSEYKPITISIYGLILEVTLTLGILLYFLSCIIFWIFGKTRKKK